MVAAPERLVMLPDREQHLKLSYAEFVARVDESAHAEWVDGEAIVFISPKERHQALANLLSTLITLFAEWLRLGIVRSAPSRCVLPWTARRASRTSCLSPATISTV